MSLYKTGPSIFYLDDLGDVKDFSTTQKEITYGFNKKIPGTYFTPKPVDESEIILDPDGGLEYEQTELGIKLNTTTVDGSKLSLSGNGLKTIQTDLDSEGGLEFNTSNKLKIMFLTV